MFELAFWKQVTRRNERGRESRAGIPIGDGGFAAPCQLELRIAREFAPGAGGVHVPKKPKAKHEETRTEIPPGAIIYGYATVEDVDGMRHVHIHGRGGRYSSLLAKKGAKEVVLPGASIVGISPNYKYVA